MQPSCPSGYSLNDKKCVCDKDKPEKLPRCPRGSRRDKKTRKCVPTKPVSGTRKASTPKKALTVKRRRKLGPKTRKITFANQTEVAVVAAAKHVVDTPKAKADVAAVQENPSPGNLIRQQDAVISGIEEETVKRGSFSPAVNKKLVSLRNGQLNPLFECGAARAFGVEPSSSAIEVGVLRADGSTACVPFNSKEAEKAMIATLKANAPLVCSKLIMPLQIESNCWFNTWFSVFFVSDKGRKFFRYLRQYMIEGRTLAGQAIRPKGLAEALRLLNLCVEATYNNTGLADPGLVINTNSVIKHIHDSLKGHHGQHIPKTGERGNPLAFYSALTGFLSGGAVSITHAKYLSQLKGRKRSGVLRASGVDADSDVVVIYTADEPREGTRPRALSDNVAPALNLVGRLGAQYKLDSVIVRDLKKNHFVSLLTCNGQQVSYDGAGFTSLRPLKWHAFLKGKGRDKVWRVPGSRVSCSMSGSYCMYVYYKTARPR